jgi:SAM-dependent methyltransferase
MTRSCPMCSHFDCEVLHTQRFVFPESYNLPDHYNVVACISCGMVYADTTATQADYDLYYRTLATYASRPQYGGKRLGATVEKVVSGLGKSNPRILEVGCATGAILADLFDQGYTRVVGVDPSPECVKVCQISGLEAHIGSLANMPDVGQFDVIILSHVLEHVLDPVGSLKNLKAHCKSGTLVYIEVPAASGYATYPLAPWFYFCHEHINHYNMVGLRDLLHLSGFWYTDGGVFLTSLNKEMEFAVVYAWGLYDGLISPLPGPNTTLRGHVEKFIEKSKELEHIPLSENCPIIVWGLGVPTYRALATFLKDAEIAMIVDTNPRWWGEKIRGRTVFTPTCLRDTTEPIVITSRLAHESIRESIRNLGLKNPVLGVWG